VAAGLASTWWQYLLLFLAVTASWAGVPVIGTAALGAAAVAASQDKLDLAAVIAVAVLAGEAGGLGGYAIGRRDWWVRRRESAPRRPAAASPSSVQCGSGLGSSGDRCGAAGAIIVADRARDDRRPAMVRALSLALVVVLVAEAAGVTARLVVDLVKVARRLTAPLLFSASGSVSGCTRSCLCFLYWVLDGGGPDARMWAPPEYPNLAFPEQLNPVVAGPSTS
jgi:hypothetical protein